MAINFVLLLFLYFLIQNTLIVTGTYMYCNKTLVKEIQKEGLDFNDLCLKNAQKINDARARNESVPNVPKTDLTDKNVTFMLLPTIKPNDIQNLTTWNRTSLQHCSYDRRKLTWMHIPGVGGDANSDAERIRPLLGSLDINLIMVNWNTYSLHYDTYYLLNNTVPALGIACAKFVEEVLFGYFCSSPDQIKMTGASAGAQAAGLCGKRMKEKVAVIMGFDPAGPCFIRQNDSYRLAKTDARYVVIFHCSAVFGVQPYYNGVADYFLGCAGVYLIDCINQTSRFNIGLCSHVKCGDYLFATITNPNNLIGVHCDSQEQFFNKNCSYFNREIVGFHSRPDVFGKIYASIPYSLEPSYNNIQSSWLPKGHYGP